MSNHTGTRVLPRAYKSFRNSWPNETEFTCIFDVATLNWHVVLRVPGIETFETVADSPQSAMTKVINLYKMHLSQRKGGAA